jgi:anti-anti-sigma regulatory factor
MNSEAEDSVEVAILGKCVYLKPEGFATQRNSLGIPEFLDAMFRTGCTHAVFDLSECRGMDSTFLGVIADAATALPQRRGKTVIILNANERGRRQLRRVGLLPLVRVLDREVKPPEPMELRKMDFVDFPKTQYEKLKKIRDLHQRLIGLNEGNRELFGPFIEMVEEELEQTRQAEEQQEQ